MQQKCVRSARDEHGQLLRDEQGHPILIEEYVDRGPRIARSSFDGRMQHQWARKGYFESSPPPSPDDALASSWPTPVPNKRRRKKVA